MSDAKNPSCYRFVLDFTNYTPVTHTVFPELCEFGSMQCAAYTAGIRRAMLYSNLIILHLWCPGLLANYLTLHGV